jgi:hypothetical protein
MQLASEHNSNVLGYSDRLGTSGIVLASSISGRFDAG